MSEQMYLISRLTFDQTMRCHKPLSEALLGSVPFFCGSMLFTPGAIHHQRS